MLKMILPREHGTWMMFFVPVLAGIVSGGPKWIHLPFLIGWFLLYLSSTPMLQMIRKPKAKGEMLPWFIGYSGASFLFLLPVILSEPLILLIGSLLVPLLLMNIYFIKKKNERNMLNDLIGILIFSLGAIAAYTIGKGRIEDTAFILALFVTFYFLGSAFYVKSLIRERNNKRFSVYSHLYHGLLWSVPWLFAMGGLVAAYVPGILKDWFTTRERPIKPIVIGIIEIINSLWFLGGLLFFF
ncbi:YwiC-like family protein [Pseudalkalibacillus sp. R45]|uniref:YwiC-like family protein n=1 Tax=Pseudalkalibacillus sp. R45 TaxID=3457433 RepID=UPI003FCDFCED